MPFTRAMIGTFDVDLAHEFFQGFVNHALVTLHVDNLRGDNAHHQAETVFKAFARALRMAVARDPARGRRRAVDQGRAVARTVGCRPSPAQPPMTDIAVVDYGMGNLRSVAKALAHVAPERDIVVTADPAVIRARRARRAAGQSAMPDCMRCLDASGLRDVGARGGARRGRSSASASACRCCSTRARRARPPGLARPARAASCAFATRR